MERYDYIDALRGYAILGVIAAHVSQQVPGLEWPFRALADQGARGVQLFFVVSALTLASSWHQRKDGTGPFFLRRFCRIAPMFWLAILVFLVLDGFAPRWWAPGGIGWPEVVETIFFVHGWHPQSINSVVPGGWSIAVETAFYLVFPLMMLFIRSWWAAALAFLACYFALRLLNPIAFNLWPEQPQNLRAEFVFLWLPNQVQAFLAGLLVFHLSRRLAGCIPRYALETAIASTIALLLAAPFLPVRPSLVVPFYATLFGVIALALSLGAGGWLIGRPIQWIGTISYSGYFWHFGIIGALQALAVRYGFNPLDLSNPSHGIAHAIFLFLLIAPISLLGASLTYHFVEKPWIAIGKAVIAARRRSLPEVRQPADGRGNDPIRQGRG